MGQAVGRELDDTCSAVMVQRQWREVWQREPVHENRHLETGSRRSMKPVPRRTTEPGTHDHGTRTTTDHCARTPTASGTRTSTVNGTTTTPGPGTSTTAADGNGATLSQRHPAAREDPTSHGRSANEPTTRTTIGKQPASETSSQMHVKFIARGTSSAKAAVDYLLGERDAAGQLREGVEVCRGDPEVVAAVADSLAFEHRYLRRDRLGAGEPADRCADQHRARRVREDGVDGVGAGSLRVDGGPAPRARWRRPCARPHGPVRLGDGEEPQHSAAQAGSRPSTRCATPSTTDTAGASPTTRRGRGHSNSVIAPIARRRSCGSGWSTRPTADRSLPRTRWR